MSLVSDNKKRKCASIGCTAAAALETGLDPDRLEHAEETYLPRTRATEEKPWLVLTKLPRGGLLGHR